MNDLEERILSGKISAKEFLEQIGFFKQDHKYKELEKLIQGIITSTKVKIFLASEGSNRNCPLRRSIQLDKENFYFNNNNIKFDTISRDKEALKHFENLQKTIYLDRLKEIKKNDLEKDSTETKYDKLLTLFENLIKTVADRKTTSNFGRKKIKINESKNYTKKEAAEIFGLSIRRTEQIIDESGLKYEIKRRGREKVISGKNLKEIIKKRA